MSEPDDLPESYIEADPNEGFDPEQDVDAGTAYTENPDSPRKFGERLALGHREAAHAALVEFREAGDYYIKTYDLGDELDMSQERAKCMMHVFENAGWISRWGASTGITWFIEPTVSEADPSDIVAVSEGGEHDG